MAPSTPLRNPVEYFRRRDRPSLAVSAGIVFVEAVAICVVLWSFLQQVMGQVDTPADADAQLQSSITGALFGVFFAVVLGWVLLAAVLHVFVWFADADRGFGTTLAIVGEAELVGIVLMPVTAFGLFSMVGQVPSDPAAAQQFFERATSFNSPLLLLSSFVGTVWKATIQGIGLSESHDVPAGKTLALTFVVGVIGFLLNLA